MSPQQLLPPPPKKNRVIGEELLPPPPPKKKEEIGSENGTTEISNDQYTNKISDEAAIDLGTTLGDNTQQPASKVGAAQVQFANIPKPKTVQEQLVDAGKGIVAKQEATKKSIDIFNQSYGTDFDPKVILNDPDKASDFLNLYKSKVAQADLNINSKLQPQNIIASSESFGQPSRTITPTVLPNIDLLTKAKPNEELLTNKVIDLSVGEGKMKGLTKSQVINNLYKRLDPKGFERTKSAIDDRTDISAVDFLTGQNPLSKDNTKEFELLNTEKAPYEFAYNESLKRQANDMQVMGTLSGNQQLIDGAKSISAQVQSDDDIYAQYPSLNKSRIAADISKEIAAKTGQLKGSDAEGVANVLNKFRGQSDPFNTDAFKKYYDNPTTRDAALEVAANPDNYLPDASFLGGVFKNVAKPFKELGMSVLDFANARDKMDRLADAKNEELFPEITPQLKGYVSKIKGAVNTTAYLTGMMAIQLPATSVGSALGLGVKGATRFGTSMAFGIPSFDGNLKDADNFLQNDGAKAAYATLGAMINAVGGEFLELGKISKFTELQKPLLELSEKMTDKAITEGAINELLNKAKDPYINAIMKYGTNVAKGAATMSYFTFANGVNKMLFGGNETTKGLIENTGTAFIDGVLGMSVLGAFGAHADMKNEKNTTYKANIKQWTDNSDATRDVIETAYKNGQYTRPEYNEKVQILNTAIAAKNNLAIAEAGNNVTLDEGQKAVYITNRTAEGIVSKLLKNEFLTEQEKGTYNAQLKRLQTQREDILKGLTFNDNLEPLDAVFKAQLEYKKAYEDFNEGVVENDSQVLQAKENLEKAIADNGKSTEQIKLTTETTTKEQAAETQKNDMAGLSHADWFLKNKDKFTEEEFNRINTELTSTDEAVKQNAVDEIVTKKDEVKKALEGIPKTESPKTEQSVTAETTQPSTVKSEEVKYPLENPDKWTSVVEEKDKGRLSYITPDEFLSKAKELEMDESDRKTIDRLKQHILDGKKLDPLEVYSNDRSILGSNIDGRHRAVAAKELGIKEVPVIDYTKLENKPIQNEEAKTPIERAKELVNSGVVKGFTSEVLKEAANNNETEFKNHLKDIAEQAQDPRSEKETINTYGKELVDIANELNPKENISSPINTETNGESNGKEADGKSGSKESSVQDGTKNGQKNDGKENVDTTTTPLEKGTASEKSGVVPSVEGAYGKNPPTDTKDLFGEGEDAEKNKKEFDKMTSTIPNGGEVKKYLSGETITKYEGGELRNNQEITAQELDPALRHGVDVIDKAKEIFGDDYVGKTLDYIERENINPENKALLYVSLENEMAKRVLEEPDNLDLKKKQDLVREKSQAYLRSNSLAINMGRLRKFAEAGYDITKVTDKFFSSKEREQKNQVEKLVQADADTINKEAVEQAQNNEAPKMTELDEKIKEGVEKEINKIYEKLPKTRKDYADKAIKALENFQKKLRGKAYDAALGVPVAIIDAGVTTIKLAIKAGVKVADAIELGINKIKEKYGKEWDKEKEFRADMLEGFKSSGIKDDKELNPKEYVKNALIKEGFGRTVNVKTKEGVEKREILDWKKLAGEEGSVTKISENVAKSLKEDNFTLDELKEMQDTFIKEYTDLRTSVIEKGLNEIATRNKTTVTPDQKSAAKKLAEMYNYGLFDKDLEGYETALAKTIGVDKLNAENLKEALVLGKAISNLYTSRFQGERLSENQMRSAIQVVENHMRHLLHSEATSHGSTALKIADTVRTYMDLTQRMTLNSIKQAAENPLSGKMEDFFTKIGYSGSIPNLLNRAAGKAARDIYKEMVLQKGQNFGEVSSTFVNKGNLEMELDKMSDSQVVQGILSTVIGRTTLDAVDSMYKAKITQQKFTYNLIKILQNDRLVDGKVQKGMSKQEAKNYVAEKLAGQSFKDAQTTSKEIIDRVNKDAGRKIFNDSPLFVDRLANDIVTAALVNGQKISEEMVTASYNAAYKAAGRGLGHVANNFISEGIGSVSGKLESKINEAIKEKEYKKAAMLTYASIFFRNIANPFVGGGTNWVVLKMEKSGLGLLSGLGSMAYGGRKMDLTSEAGVKDLEKAMYQSLKVKDKFLRGAIGGAATVVGAMILAGVTNTDEYREWRKNNKWATKYLDLVTPEIILAAMAKESKQLKYYFETAFNKNDAFDKGTMAVKAAVAAGSGDEKAGAKAGKLVGSMFGAPAPWRLIRDGQQIWVGANGGEPYKVDNTPSETFLQGYFKGGMIDYMGFAPKPDK